MAGAAGEVNGRVGRGASVRLNAFTGGHRLPDGLVPEASWADPRPTESGAVGNVEVRMVLRRE